MPGFINCPFTTDYAPLFRALVFAVLDCGFIPVSAQERGGSQEIRLQKIVELIRSCRYGIHDLSATHIDATTKLPRFNMPLELGLFIGALNFGSGRQRNKGYLVLDTMPFDYRKHTSDLGGQDILAHAGEPRRAIKAVRNWLRRERAVLLPGASRMAERYEKFSEDLPVIASSINVDPDELIYNDLTTVVERWLKKNPW